MRLRRRKDTKQFLEQQQHLIVLNPMEYKGKWHEYFGNNNPIYVEFGMGKGSFISGMSLKYPEVNFIGIDMYDELIRKAGEKAWETHGLREGENVPNLALALVNLQQVEDVFAENELEKIFLNFSDPWPKKRHASRRLTHCSFVKKYLHILNERGVIQLRTDSKSLFEFSLNTFADMDLRLRNIYLDLHAEGTPEDHVFTEYEAKFVSRGVPIQQCEVLTGKLILQQHREQLSTRQATSE